MKKIFTLIVMSSLAIGLVVPSASGAVNVAPSKKSSDPVPATVTTVLENYKNLSGKERKALNRDIKKAIKNYKADVKNKKEPVAGTLIQVLAAILFPPLGVYLHEGEINKRFWIALVLTLLFYIPGLIYALVVILGDGGADM